MKQSKIKNLAFIIQNLKLLIKNFIPPSRIIHFPRAWMNPRPWENTLRITNFAFLIIFFFSSCWTNPFWRPILFPEIKPDNKWIMLIPLAFQGKATPSNQTTTVTVTGTVTNTSGTALGNHTVTFQPTGTTTTTDASGNYTVSLPPGTYTATVTDSTGAVVGTFTITVVADGTTSVAVNTGGIIVTANGVTGQSNTGGNIVTANGVTGQPNTVATPVFTPAAGTYSTDQSVTITTATTGATIYYTLDGSAPFGSSQGATSLYNGAISVTGNGTSKTIKAIAVKSGLANSAVGSGTWVIDDGSVNLWNGIVAYYPFNGNAKDESGYNNNNGTVNAGVALTTDKFGSANKAYSFDGVDDFINTVPITLNNMSFSIVSKIYLNNFTNTQGILSQTSGLSCTDNNCLSFAVMPNRKVRFGFYGGSTYYVDSNQLLNPNQWHELVASYSISDNKMKIYIDSVEDISFQPSGAYARPSSEILIGKNWEYTVFNGKLDDIRIYNRALSQTEILSLYKNSNNSPTAGNSGLVSTSNITSTSLTLNWTAATDANIGGEYQTPQARLQYKIVRSTSNNISTVDTAEANGTLVQNWTTNISTASATGLTTGTTYYFNVLVRDEHGNKGVYAGVSEWTPVMITTFAGPAQGTTTAGDTDGTGSGSRFFGPMGITNDGSNLYISDNNNHKIRKIVISNGAVTTLAGPSQGTSASGDTDGTGNAARFNQPAGIANDGTNLYIADTWNHKIRKIIISTGAVTTLAGPPQGTSASGDTDGTGNAARFTYPSGIINDGSNIYVADTHNHKIRKIVISNGAVTTLAGPPQGTSASGDVDGTGNTARFNLPFGIANDGTNVYIADTSNNKIRKIVISTGAVTTLAGPPQGTIVSGDADGISNTARFYSPYGIVYIGGNLYLSDTSNNKIRKIAL